MEGASTVATEVAPAEPPDQPASPTERTEQSEDSTRAWAVPALVALVTLGGLLVRLPSFHQSLFGDEISTYYIVHGHSLGRVLQLVHSNQETTPPLFFILAWATKGVLGSQVESIRLISLVTGTAAIPMTFVLGMWTVGRRAALVGATLVALCPFLIFFSTEARPYMLVLFFALASTLCLLRAIDTGRVGWWAGYAAASCAAAYTHYTVVFLLVAQFVWALWTSPRSRPALVIANLAAGVAYLPWLGGLREDLHAPNFIGGLQPFGIRAVASDVASWWIGQPYLVPLRLMPGRVAVVLAASGLAVGLLGLLLRLTGERSSRPSWRLPPGTVLVLVLAVASPLLMALYSWLRVDIWESRNLLASWPGLALVIGAIVMSPRSWLRWAAVGLTLVGFAIGAARTMMPAAQRTDDAAAVAYLDRVAAPGDPIVSSPSFGNPLSDFDVAMGNAGFPTYTPGNTRDIAHPFTGSQVHPVIRLGSPSLAVQLHFLDSPKPISDHYGLPIEPAGNVARSAVALARNGTVYLVTASVYFNSNTTSISYLLRTHPNNPTSLFVKALPSRYRLTRQVSFPGFFGYSPVTVYEFPRQIAGTPGASVHLDD